MSDALDPNFCSVWFNYFCVDILVLNYHTHLLYVWTILGRKGSLRVTSNGWCILLKKMLFKYKKIKEAFIWQWKNNVYVPNRAHACSQHGEGDFFKILDDFTTSHFPVSVNAEEVASCLASMRNIDCISVSTCNKKSNYKKSF